VTRDVVRGTVVSHVNSCQGWPGPVLHTSCCQTCRMSYRKTHCRTYRLRCLELAQRLEMPCVERLPWSGHKRRAEKRISLCEEKPCLCAHLDHLFRRKALASEVRRMFRQSILWLRHSRWSRLRSVDSSAAERDIVTAAEKRTTHQYLVKICFECKRAMIPQQ
jgi:hypothetical protein